jgi:hypothetical protein
LSVRLDIALRVRTQSSRGQRDIGVK